MIEVRNLTKRYGSKLAVDNVSFDVKEGQILGFLGPNGAGKSTTMNIITGYISSGQGTVKIDGIDVLEDPIEAKKRIGYLPEQPPLYLDMTVKDYLNFVFNLKGCKLNRKKHLEEICELVKITDHFERLNKNLSKGYRQRVGLAQALIGNPKVLILDEPTVGLDPKQIIEIRNLIKALGKGHTIILSSHILPEVQAICEKLIVIANGKVVADDTPENLSKNVSHSSRVQAQICGRVTEVLKTVKSLSGIRYAELLNEKNDDSADYIIEFDPGVDMRRGLFNALAEKNFPLIGLRSLNMSLEDIFISLTGNEQAEREEA